MERRYEKQKKVGERAYGKVYKVRDKATGQLVAPKQTRLAVDQQGVPASSLREISLLQTLSQSLYVVRLLEVEHVDKTLDTTPAPGTQHRPKRLLYLLFEYLDTDLKKFIDSHFNGPNPRPIPPSHVQSFLFQLCKGIAYCHSHGVLHRDLRPQNLLIDEQRGIMKIADLGLGRAFSVPIRNYTHEVVTLYY